MAPPYADDSYEASVRRTLRALNSLAGLCGFVINTVTLTIEKAGEHGHAVSDLTSAAYIPIILSIAWNHLETRALRRLPQGRGWTAMIVDAGISLGFLALVIGNAFVTTDLMSLETRRIMLFTYNTMPWIICDILHLFFALQTCKELLGSIPSWRSQSVCSDCQRRIPNNPGRTRSGAGYSLLNDQAEDNDLEDNRVQATGQAKGPIHLADDA